MVTRDIDLDQFFARGVLAFVAFDERTGPAGSRHRRLAVLLEHVVDGLGLHVLRRSFPNEGDDLEGRVTKILGVGNFAPGKGALRSNGTISGPLNRFIGHVGGGDQAL